MRWRRATGCWAIPAAVRKILDTGGESLVKGAQNLVHDMRHNHMLPSQVDSTPFKLGENMATTPGPGGLSAARCSN